MLEFNCDNCDNLIEDICGEYVNTDDDGNVISYRCPHCGKTINVDNNEYSKKLSGLLSSMTDEEFDKLIIDYQHKDGFPLAKDYIDYVESQIEHTK